MRLYFSHRINQKILLTKVVYKVSEKKRKEGIVCTPHPKVVTSESVLKNCPRRSMLVILIQFYILSYVDL